MRPQRLTAAFPRVLALASLMSFFTVDAANATGLHYCSGKVLSLVTRGTDENTQLRIENMTGWARIGYGGDAQKEMHRRQVAMLLTAYALGKSVVLEFEDDGITCSMSHDGRLIRFVLLGND